MNNNNYSSINAIEIIKSLEEPTDDRRPLKYALQRKAHIKDLIKALTLSKKVLTKRILCDILAARRAKSAIPALLNCLNDSDPSLKNDAAEALGKIGDPAAGEEILRHFINEPRLWYAGALGAIGYQPAIPYLISALDSNLGGVRGGAAWSLGEFRAKEALEPLKRALASETDDYAQARMREAIDLIEQG